MKSPVAQRVAQRLAIKLGEQFRDQRPIVDSYDGSHEIAVESPRGEKFAFVEVQSDYAGSSTVRFWNGDLYWTDHRVSGMWPDVMRDNWHRFEWAHRDCQPTTAAARPPARRPSSPAPASRPGPIGGQGRPDQAPGRHNPGAPRDLTP